jgi:hypothetical protein
MTSAAMAANILDHRGGGWTLRGVGGEEVERRRSGGGRGTGAEVGVPWPGPVMGLPGRGR